MKNRLVAFAGFGTSLLGLAVFLAVRQDPARDDGLREEPTRVPEGAPVEGKCSDQVEEPVWGRLAEGESSVAGEIRHDDPDVLQATSLWLVGPILGPAHGESPRVPLPIADGAFARSGLAPGEYAANGVPVENPVFTYPGFHEHAPLLPGGGQRFFDSQ